MVKDKQIIIMMIAFLKKRWGQQDGSVGKHCYCHTSLRTWVLCPEPESRAQNPWWKERNKSVPKSCFLTSTCLPAHVCKDTISFLWKYVICTIGNLDGERIKLWCNVGKTERSVFAQTFLVEMFSLTYLMYLLQQQIKAL